jgi:DNA repair exonuclease SbcCD ATPase subunit
VSIIQRVEISGYRSVGEKQVIDLSKPGLVLLTGDNRDRGKSSAAGKSSIFKAITTCLFEENDDGSIKRNGVNVMRPEEGLRIAVNFLDDRAVPHCAVYTYGHPTEGSDWYLWQWNGTAWKDLREEKKGDTKGVIQGVLRMDYNQFLNRAYMAQETVAEFIWRTQKERIEIFSGILHLGVIDTWVQNARDWKKDTEKDVQKTQGKITLLTQQIERAKQALKSADEIVTMRQDVAEIDAGLKEIEDQLEAKEEEAKQISSLITVKANQKAQGQRLADLQTKKAAIGIVPTDDVVTEEKVKVAKEDRDKSEASFRDWSVKLRAAQQRLAEVEALGDACGSCEQPIDGDIRRRLLESREHAVGGCEIKETQERRKRDHMLAHYESVRSRYETISSKQCEHHKIDAEIRKAQGVLDSYTRQIEDMRRILGDAVDYPDRLNEEYRALTDRQVLLHQDRTAKQGVLNAALRAQDEYQGLLRDKQTQEQETERLEERIGYLKKVEAALGDRGFRAYKIKSSRVAFNNSLNRYLSVLTDGEVEAELVTEVPKADGKGTKAELDILVRDGEKAGVPIRQYSGGEKGTLSLGITGSFWDLSSQQSGGSVNLLLLDEPFANMDPWQIEKACVLLASMRESGRTILVVTNQQSVRDRGLFDREIRAIKEKHITRFEEYDLTSNH